MRPTTMLPNLPRHPSSPPNSTRWPCRRSDSFMYHQFYAFDISPFENTRNPRLFFASEQHREALAAIEYTIRLRKGIVLVTGDVGSGKTTVCRTLQERCSDSAHIVQLT